MSDHIDHWIEQIHYRLQEIANELNSTRETMMWVRILKPTLSLDGDQWCALYGSNLKVGIAGFGDTPAKALIEFEREMNTPVQRAGGKGAG